MRRIVLFVVAVAALAAPAAVLAATTSAGDGTLVVQRGQAPDKVPVVRLTITGSVIGQVSGPQGRIIIDQAPKSPPPDVTGAGAGRAVPQSDTAQQWLGDADGFKFRAVGGTYTIVIYGSGVSVVAVGSGTVQLAGMPNTPTGDGRYSLNGQDWKSLPGTPTGKLAISDTSNG